jgi:hypothetical protein
VAVIEIVFAGGAVQTVAPGAWTPSSPGPGGTFSVVDDTGYPLTGAFTIRVSKGNDDEEHVKIASRLGTTFTVAQRGYDGTNAQSHDSPTVEIYFPAEVANLLVDHVDGIEVDPHATTLLNNARHDITARHTYGAALGTRPLPSSVGTANAAGSGSNPAAGDHVHRLGVGSIDASNLFAAGVVSLAAMATDSVDATKIVADSVGASELADNAVAQANMQDNSVGTLELIDLNVTNAKLAASSVTQSKFAAENPTAYTPSWDASGTPPSIGNGSLGGTYYAFGKLIVFTIQLVFGSTTVPGTGVYELGLPVPAAWGSGFPLPSLTVMNNSGTRFIGINIMAGSSQKIRVLERITLDDIAHNAPFTWGTADFLQASGAYFAA